MKDDPQHNIVLQRTDRIYIRNKTGWTPEKKVTLRGQIAYPGTYVLLTVKLLVILSSVLVDSRMMLI